MMARTITMKPGPAGTGASGVVRVVEAGGGAVRIEAEVMGVKEGEHAWHIHRGACDKKGPVLVAITPTNGMQGIGESIRTGADGRGMGTVTIPADKVPAGLMPGMAPAQAMPGQDTASGQGGLEVLSLHIHERGGKDHGEAVLCAELMEMAPPTTR
jgi:hypothetical protein